MKNLIEKLLRRFGYVKYHDPVGIYSAEFVFREEGSSDQYSRHYLYVNVYQEYTGKLQFVVKVDDERLLPRRVG